MKWLFKMIIVLSLIVIIFTGCNTIENDKPDSSNTTQPAKEEQIDNKPTDEKPKEEGKTPDSSSIDNQRLTFNEAFPKNIIDEPQVFLEQLIPGFKMGLSNEEAERLLGTPDVINATENEWGQRTEWVYEDIKGYQFILTFNDLNEVVNFKLVKYLDSRGVIPKVTNKTAPKDGEPVTYTELGFEGVLLGSKIDEVLERFGDPYKSYLSYDEMYGYDLAMVYRGITIHTILEHEEPYIQFIETNELGTVTTYRNISVGSSIEEVINRYGEPPYDWQGMDSLIYSTEDFWFAIKFEIENDKVASISIYEAS
ncbi:hypothetical protein BHF71_02745 [Vulcanibacillus modesticaldus]|uniref:Uncharacterized protein n=1 Tax=Vulcanibacillus modesticaldus TaxID=337097 RepID=A0A1D2YT25_9BACI|nr:hypothetical protein [Vulcanibacillus modesticaldus]OEF98862.1 hypothetical protein BHF71_02745 [Vulcanibacillus modesticaldus]